MAPCVFINDAFARGRADRAAPLPIPLSLTNSPCEIGRVAGLVQPACAIVLNHLGSLANPCRNDRPCHCHVFEQLHRREVIGRFGGIGCDGEVDRAEEIGYGVMWHGASHVDGLRKAERFGLRTQRRQLRSGSHQ